jgi:hypothetical protein
MVTGGLLALACYESEARFSPAARAPVRPLVLDGGQEMSSAVGLSGEGATLLGEWCTRAGEDSTMQLVTIDAIVDDYRAEQAALCAPLTSQMDPAQSSAWTTYLASYTRFMAGCLNVDVPPPGGILAFGPANTAAIGMPQPALSQDDARILIGAYAGAFSSALALLDTDRELVEAHLSGTADRVVDASLPAGPTLCSDGDDAGD